MKNFKSKFSLTAWRRFIILIATLIATIIAIIVVPIFYTSKHITKSPEYSGGAEYVVEIKTNDKNVKADDVAQEIYGRIDQLGIAGVDVRAENLKDQHFVRVTYPGTVSSDDVKKIEKEITQKPKLVFTDIWGNPIFTASGNFDSAHLKSTNNSAARPLDKIDWKGDTTVPLQPGAAKAVTQSDGNKVQLSLVQNKSVEWLLATNYISSLGADNNKILVWLNMGDLIKQLKNTQGKTTNLWDESSQDPFKAIHVDNNIKASLRDDASKYYFGDANKYLLSAATVSQILNGNEFVIEGNFTAGEANDLARKINFGAANYSLQTKFVSTINATYGSDAFRKAIIAAIVVFSVIAIFLIVNYGLLGALATISIALYMMITLTLFTVMRGEYSPESIAALIIGIGMSVDANIITFERLKHEIYAGSKLRKAEKIANRRSFWTIFDANITTLIVACVLFYFGTRNIIGLSITLMLSILLTLIVMLGFTRVTSSLLMRTGWFDNRLGLLGIKPKIDNAIQNKIAKVDYMKASKYFMWLSGAIIVAGAIVLVATAIVAGHFGGGFNLSNDFKEGAVYQFKVNDPTQLTNAENLLGAAGFSNHDFQYGYGTDANGNSIVTSLKVATSSGEINPTLDPNVNPQLKADWGNNFNISITSSAVANALVRNALIAVGVAIAGITIYALIRFRWTYAIAAIIALLHDAIIVIVVFVITRVEVSPVFIAGLLSIMGYSINDTIVTFDRIREKMNSHIGEFDGQSIKKLANEAIVDTLKRSLLTSLTTIIAVVILMSFGNATKLEFNFAMLVGLVFGTYSSIVVAAFLWTKLESIRQRGISKRSKSDFWVVSTVEEQTIPGINDFRA